MNGTMATHQDSLGFIAHHVDYRIKSYVEQADDYTLKMNEDFEYFYRWHSEDMYKIQLLLKHYRKLKEVVNGGDLKDVFNFMMAEVKRIEKRLLESQLHMSSSSQASNIAFIFELEVEQKMRQEYLSIIHNIEL